MRVRDSGGARFGCEKRILIADDNPAIRCAVRYSLERHIDCNVIEARDGAQAVDLAAEIKPDLIVLDVAMPRLNGN